jgi:4-carboxymuconolactone decarboxylase
MARIHPIPRDEMSAEQIRVNDTIAAARVGGQASGPFAIWLRTPEFAELAGYFGMYLRTRTTLPRRLLELTVLVTARNWTAQYEWYAHEKFVGVAGLDADLVEDLRLGRRPDFKAADEAVVFDVAIEIDRTKTLSADTYQRALDTLGEQTVIDLLTVIGYYTMIAVVLVGLEVDTPDSSTPLAPLGQ